MPVFFTIKFQTKTLDDARLVMEVALDLGWDPSDDEPMMTRDPAEILDGREVGSVPPYMIHPAQVEREFASQDEANATWMVLRDAINERIGYRPKAVLLPRILP